MHPIQAAPVQTDGSLWFESEGGEACVDTCKAQDMQVRAPRAPIAPPHGRMRLCAWLMGVGAWLMVGRRGLGGSRDMQVGDRRVYECTCVWVYRCMGALYIVACLHRWIGACRFTSYPHPRPYPHLTLTMTYINALILAISLTLAYRALVSVLALLFNNRPTASLPSLPQPQPLRPHVHLAVDPGISTSPAVRQSSSPPWAICPLVCSVAAGSPRTQLGEVG